MRWVEGRGCLAGPVVTSAVILPNDFDYEIVKDSKKLSEKKRLEAFQLIKEKCIDYVIDFLDSKHVDDNNILKSTMVSMHNCVDKLKSDGKVTPQHLLVDGNQFEPYEGIEHTCVVKGDNKYYSIAAASILAKVSRDEYMKERHKENPNYGWDTNKGYGSKQHRESILKHGVTKEHRLSFLKNILPN